MTNEQQRLLLLLKLDAQNVFKRITERFPEYIHLFSLKRSRDHFKDIFRNRYESTRVYDLKFCSEETLVVLNQYYNEIDNLKWYLDHTEDMPQIVEDKVSFVISQLRKMYEMAQLYLDADLSGKSLLELENEIENENDQDNLTRS